MARHSDDQNTKNTLFCDPWNGSRSSGFIKFKRDFKTGAEAMFLHEDDYSIYQCLTDLDQGGQGPGADQLPGQQQNGHANAVRRRKKRVAKAYQMIYNHTDDERLKEMLDALPSDDRRAASACPFACLAASSAATCTSVSPHAGRRAVL